MNLSNLIARVRGKYQRSASDLLHRRPLAMRNTGPLVSFTFDDFPKNALYRGGAILEKYGARGTYFASFGLTGSVAPTGEIFRDEDVAPLLERGHEIGCHTFQHCDSWDTDAASYDMALERNRQALARVAPGVTMQSFGYPLTTPSPSNKKAAGARFASCRGGGQTYNAGELDRSLLKSFFLEKSVHDPGAVKDLVARSAAANGWLIFSTHDVSEQPTRFGCTPEFFEQVVAWSQDSGARIATVAQALEAVGGAGVTDPR
jgi:peptidoglycan/xylan/chitin deacetylase (PgdA/CDA1 family)